MKVILNQDVKGHGKKGDIVNVADGYAANFLLPRGLASPANSSTINDLKGKKDAAAHKIEVEKAEAEKISGLLSGKNIKFSGKAGSDGKLYGSITAKDISDKLKEEFKIDVDKRKIVLHEAIKSFGEYDVTAKLYNGVSAVFKITVAE